MKLAVSFLISVFLDLPVAPAAVYVY